MALPGTPGQRISDLCNGNHITQKELAEKIGVSASQLSRIVSGETRTVSSDILIGVAKEFKVSTDYILGLSTVSVRKSYDISELGLSEGAVRGLVTGAVDVQILNRLLEHRNFPKLIDLIRIYFRGYGGKGHNSKKPAYRDGNGFPVRHDERTPGTPGRSEAGFTAFERPKDRGT